MTISTADLLRRLSQCEMTELAIIEEEFNLDEAHLERATVAGRARTILKMLKRRSDGAWIDKLKTLLDDIQSGVDTYLGRRLQGFVVKQSELADGVSPESVGTIKQLREKLKEGRPLKKPVLIRVRGTLFPAALLTAGWWERRQHSANPLTIEWKSKLQRWLFEGFDLWAPSWDICWGTVDSKDPSKQYYIAQLTEGDEADSLPVIIEPEKARKVNEAFLEDGWGGREVMVVGYLGHRKHFEKKLPANAKRDPEDYYISVEDGNKRNSITPLLTSPSLYSGYLWKLLVPEEHLRNEKRLRLEHVYFVWEHTNFVAEDAVAYNLDGLERKEELIAKRHPGSKLILLQKSHAIVSPEVKPHWSVEQFYNFYLKRSVPS